MRIKRIAMIFAAFLLGAGAAQPDTLGTITANWQGKEQTWFVTAKDGESQSSHADSAKVVDMFALWGNPRETDLAATGNAILPGFYVMRGPSGKETHGLGNYEIRYVMNQEKKIPASIPITVLPVGASVSTVSRAPAESEIMVSWVGPDETRDHIAVAEVGVDGGKYINYTCTETGNPVKLKMPKTPGDHEVRYILDQDKTVLARQPISVEQE